MVWVWKHHFLWCPCIVSYQIETFGRMLKLMTLLEFHNQYTVFAVMINSILMNYNTTWYLSSVLWSCAFKGKLLRLKRGLWGFHYFSCTWLCNPLFVSGQVWGRVLNGVLLQLLHMMFYSSLWSLCLYSSLRKHLWGALIFFENDVFVTSPAGRFYRD
jgi:hypothetical protein